MIVLVAALALAGSALAALPGDWARRRAVPAQTLAQLANAGAVVAIIAALAASGVVHGASGAVALVMGLVAGQYLADRFASHLWGSLA
jgi:hypothetical protein